MCAHHVFTLATLQHDTDGWREGRWQGPMSTRGTMALASPPPSPAAIPMDAKEAGSLGKALKANQLLELSKALVCAGGILPPVLVFSLLPAASSRLSPSRAQGGQGPRSCRAGAVEVRAGSLLQNEEPVLPPGCPAAPW